MKQAKMPCIMLNKKQQKQTSLKEKIVSKWHVQNRHNVLLIKMPYWHCVRNERKQLFQKCENDGKFKWCKKNNCLYTSGLDSYPEKASKRIVHVLSEMSIVLDLLQLN